MAKKKKETTSKSIIGDLVAKEWAKVKGQPRSKRGTKADVEARIIKRVAEKTGRSTGQVRKVYKGERPGKNLLEPLKAIKRGRKVQPPEKEPKKITRRKKPVEKPPEAEPPKPPPQEAPPAAPPSRVEYDFRGNASAHEDSDDESDPVRKRRIHGKLTGDLAAQFADLWRSGETFEALKLATSHYFGSVGAGYLESVIGEPVITFGE